MGRELNLISLVQTLGLELPSLVFAQFQKFEPRCIRSARRWFSCTRVLFCIAFRSRMFTCVGSLAPLVKLSRFVTIVLCRTLALEPSRGARPGASPYLPFRSLHVLLPQPLLVSLPRSLLLLFAWSSAHQLLAVVLLVVLPVPLGRDAHPTPGRHPARALPPARAVQGTGRRHRARVAPRALVRR